MNKEEVRWHRVNAGLDAKPMLWKFSGLREVIPFGVSLLLGLMLVRKLIEDFDFSIQASLIVAALLPLGTVVFLLQFVCGKPARYLGHCLQWWTVVILKKPLLTRSNQEGGLQ
ncbi:hypothetical protein AAFN60_19245 [Roseibacillus persicicus]|uniref:hypothetical protein n=1 Tax=Roseibacillus persicicus TaxID=454148 RepID=UPI00398A5FFB